jgi:hypothetical protein
VAADRGRARRVSMPGVAELLRPGSDSLIARRIRASKKAGKDEDAVPSLP